MNAATVRQPVIGGIGGGVGTSMIATLIGGLDVGVVAGDGSQVVDVLVTESTASAVRAAIGAAMAMPVRPVLVVVAHSPEGWSPPVRQRLKMCEPNLPGVARVSWISALAGCDDPWTYVVEHVFAQKPLKWALTTRKERGVILDAVTPLVSRPAPFEPYERSDSEIAADLDTHASVPDSGREQGNDPPHARVS